MAALFFICFGISFWIRTRWSFGSCVFGVPECSVAAATWTLVFVTTGAFIAAYEAAVKAGSALIVSRRALDLETKPILGQWICTSDEHRIPRVARFVTGDSISETVPDGYSQSDFAPLEFDFENLGRTALLEVVVTLLLKYDDEPATAHPIKIGNIATDKDAHVVIYLPLTSPIRPLVGWSGLAIINQKRLEFAELPFIRVEAVVPNVQSTVKQHWVKDVIGKSLGFPAIANERKWRMEFIESEASKRTIADVVEPDIAVSHVKRRNDSVREEEEEE